MGKRIEQRMYGIILILLAFLACWVCSSGQTVAEQDATGAVVMLMLGVYLLFTKNIVII